MAITIANIVARLKQLSNSDPRVNAFGAGPLYDIIDDIKYYPYLWIQNDVNHTISYTDINKYRAIEYSFILRVGDKVNNQENVYMAYGENSNNGLDISSDTFTILVDMINVISEDSLGLFSDVTLFGDIDIEPFFHEDTGDVNGHQAQIRLRGKLENPCLSPITDDLYPPVGPTQSPTQSCAEFTEIRYVDGQIDVTLHPINYENYNNAGTQFVYEPNGISWIEYIPLAIAGMIDYNGNAPLDLVYAWGNSYAGNPNAFVLGKIGNNWLLYQLNDVNGSQELYVVYNSANIANPCGIGNYNITSELGLTLFTTTDEPVVTPGWLGSELINTNEEFWLRGNDLIPDRVTLFTPNELSLIYGLAPGDTITDIAIYKTIPVQSGENPFVINMSCDFVSGVTTLDKSTPNDYIDLLAYPQSYTPTLEIVNTKVFYSMTLPTPLVWDGLTSLLIRWNIDAGYNGDLTSGWIDAGDPSVYYDILQDQFYFYDWVNLEDYGYPHSAQSYFIIKR